VGELFGVDAVVFVFAAVNEMEIERVSEHDGQAGGLAGIRQPVPAKHAFGAHGEVVPIGFDQRAEVVEVIVFDVGVDQSLAPAVHDADIHLVRMQIDSAVVFGGGGVILHLCIQ